MENNVWVEIYTRLVQRGKKTISEVPKDIRAQVKSNSK